MTIPIILVAILLSTVNSQMRLPEVPPLPPEIYGGHSVYPVNIATQPRLIGVRFLQKAKPPMPRLIGIRFLQRPQPNRPRFVGIRFLRRPEPIRPQLVGIRFIRKPEPIRPRFIGIRFLPKPRPNVPRLIGIKYIDKYRPVVLSELSNGLGTNPTVGGITSNFGMNTPQMGGLMPKFGMNNLLSAGKLGTNNLLNNPFASLMQKLGMNNPFMAYMNKFGMGTSNLAGSFSNKSPVNTIRIVKVKMPFQPHSRSFPYPYVPVKLPTFTNGPFGHGRYQHFRHPYLPQTVTSFEASKPLIVLPPALPKGLVNNGKAPIYLVQTKVSAPVFIMPNHAPTTSRTFNLPSLPSVAFPPPTFSTSPLMPTIPALPKFLPGITSPYKLRIQNSNTQRDLTQFSSNGITSQISKFPPLTIGRR